jgi:hypothetical protein
MEDFDPTQYGPNVARILAMDGNGHRLPTLTCGGCSCPAAHQVLKTFQPSSLFNGVTEPEAAMAGLWLYFSCFEEAHQLIDDPKTTEGELWHAILHRQEPDSGNAAYWFRKAGPHPVFSKLAVAAAKILDRLPDAEFRTSSREWDPYAFVAFCDRAREQPGSAQELAAREIQRAEWQLLFDHSARPR